MATFTYNSNGGAPVAYNYTGNSGIFLCSIQTPVNGNGTTQRYGCQLQYNQTKRDHLNSDDVLVLYLGRAKPAVETSGIVAFETFDLSYAWPPTAVGVGDGAGFTIEHQIRGMLADCRTGSVIQLQTSQGSGTTYNSVTYPAYYGRLQDVVLEYPITQPGWTVLTATFTEVG